MISCWNVRNMKSIRHDTLIQLKPLTILSGTNSSGKSTLLQSILLVAQTVSTPVESRQLVLNGPLARLGRFSDIVNHSSRRQQIEIGWELKPHPRIAASQLQSTDGFPTLTEAGVQSLTGIVRFAAPSTAKANSQASLRSMAFLGTMDIDPNTEPAAFSFAANRKSDNEAFNLEMDQESTQDFHDDNPGATIESCELHGFKPVKLVVNVDIATELEATLLELLESPALLPARLRGRKKQEQEVPRPILDALAALLTSPATTQTRSGLTSSQRLSYLDLRRTIRQLDSNTRQAMREEATASTFNLRGRIQASLGVVQREVRRRPLPRSLSDSISLVDYLSTISYLGPLRDAPRSFYPISSGYHISDVGIRGENTAAVLDLLQDTKVTALPPPPTGDSTDTPIDITAQRQVSQPLLKLTKDWLSYITRSESRLETSDVGDLGHGIEIQTQHSAVGVNLTHVGVGISQALPIVVMCLLTPVDGVAIIEQPELHLHPSAQSRLADFFIAMMLSGRQCIIETHSEHIITRLRRRIVDSESSELQSLCATFFAEIRNGSTTFTEVGISEYGAIGQWPEGFFDEAAHEMQRLLSSATRKRNTRNHGKLR